MLEFLRYLVIMRVLSGELRPDLANLGSSWWQVWRIVLSLITVSHSSHNNKVPVSLWNPGCSPGAGWPVTACVQEPGPARHRYPCVSVLVWTSIGRAGHCYLSVTSPMPLQQPGESITDNIGARHEKRQSQSVTGDLFVPRYQIGRIRVPSLLRDEIFSSVLSWPDQSPECPGQA